MAQLDSQYTPLAIRIVLADIIANKKRIRDYDDSFVARWLEASGIDLDKSIPILKQLRESDSPEMRKAAAVALVKIQAKARSKPLPTSTPP